MFGSDATVILYTGKHDSEEHLMGPNPRAMQDLC